MSAAKGDRITLPGGTAAQRPSKLGLVLAVLGGVPPTIRAARGSVRDVLAM
jgi:hypothetical protein